MGNLSGLATCILAAAPTLVAAAQYDATSANADASTTMNVVRPYTGTADTLNSNLASPTVNNDKMTSFSATKFDGSISCALQNPFLELFITPGLTGDITSLSVTQDTNFDGTMDATYSVPASISGVCTNGIISCTPGTWSSCTAYTWQADGAGMLSFTPVPTSKLGGCFCVNNYCGANLVMSNLKTVLSDIGGGALSALIASNASLAISDVRFDGPIIRYYAKKMGSCTSPSSATNTAYLNNPATMSGDAASAATSNSIYTMIQSAPVGGSNASVVNACTIERVMTWDEASPDEVITFNSGSGAWSICGPGCAMLSLLVNNTVCAASDTLSYACNAGLFSLRPDRIISSTLKVSATGYAQLGINGSMVWNGPTSANWTSLTTNPGGASCVAPGYWWWNKGDEYKADTWTASADISGAFTTPGVYDLLFRSGLAPACNNEVCFNWHWGGKLKGWDCRSKGYPPAQSASFTVEFAVDTSCKVGSEVINDGCATLATNPDCVLESETVDGVQTYAGYNPTRLTPMASTRTISGKICSQDFTRDWWKKTRQYRCKTTPPTYDFSAALERKGHIDATTTATAFEDKRLVDGKWITETGTMVSAPTAPMASCTQACKTRRLRTMGDVSLNGIVGDNRTTPPAYDYVFHQCKNGACPLNAGEEVVKDCGCINDFAESAALMQTLRMAGKDMICTTGTATSLK